MKYIIFNGTMPIIFPDKIHHKEVKEAFNKDIPSSAGHMEVVTDKTTGELDVITYGAAETIGMMPEDSDADTLTNFLTETE